MTWEWSHTAEGIDNAYNNLCKLPKEKLEVTYAEWLSAYKDTSVVVNGFELLLTPAYPEFFSSSCHTEFAHNLYDGHLERAKTFTADVLANAIWSYASELRECDNGGFNAYVCPFQCHSVSFSNED